MSAMCTACSGPMWEHNREAEHRAGPIHHPQCRTQRSREIPSCVPAAVPAPLPSFETAMSPTAPGRRISATSHTAGRDCEGLSWLAPKAELSKSLGLVNHVFRGRSHGDPAWSKTNHGTGRIPRFDILPLHARGTLGRIGLRALPDCSSHQGRHPVVSASRLGLP